MAPKISSAMMFVRLIEIASRRLPIAGWPLDNLSADRERAFRFPLSGVGRY
jgi:hypothetical protein